MVDKANVDKWVLHINLQILLWICIEKYIFAVPPFPINSQTIAYE